MNHKNIRTILVACLALLFMNNLLAQDAIIKQNGEQIKCKVAELTETTIKYRKFDNLTGPIYNINKTEVVVINYEDGTTEVIQQKRQDSSTGLSTNRTPGNQNRERDFQFYDKSVSINFTRLFNTNGISIDFEQFIQDEISLRFPIYIGFDEAFSDRKVRPTISGGINLKYHFYRDTWVDVFAGPEVNIGFYPTPDFDANPFQALGDIGIAVTPTANFKITTHVGLGYEVLFIKNQTINPSGFAFNFNVGLGYNF